MLGLLQRFTRKQKSLSGVLCNIAPKTSINYFQKENYAFNISEL